MRFVLASSGMVQVNSIPSISDIGNGVEKHINDTVQQYIVDKIEHFFSNIGDWIMHNGLELAQQTTLLAGFLTLFLAVLRSGKGAGLSVKLLSVSVALTIIESRLQM